MERYDTRDHNNFDRFVITNVSEVFYNSSLNWDLSSWLRNVNFCLGTNNKTFVYGSVSIMESVVSFRPLKKTPCYEFQNISLNSRDCELVPGKFDKLTYLFQKREVPFWFSVWLEFLQSVSYLCGKGNYIWKEVSKTQIVIVFPAKKNQSSAEALTAVPCHGEKSSTRKQRSIYPYHILCSSSVHNLSIILKTVYIILNNSSKWQQYQRFFFFLPILAWFEKSWMCFA